jgi:L-fucose isomerase-like protein
MNSRKIIQLVASGDLRLSANQTCWPAQRDMEAKLTSALAAEGFAVNRAHPFKRNEGHGFIASQREGIEIFRHIDPQSPLIVAEAVWQYSHHVLPGLTTHRGPILTVANWSGQWPGLVGMLNLNGSLAKAGIPFSTLWSGDFTDDFFLKGLRQWLRKGRIDHDMTHVTPADAVKLPAAPRKLGESLARELIRDKAILGIFDEGCMGMFNAIIPDHALHACSVFKERLSQSALYHETLQVPDCDATAVRTWLEKKGMTFHTGKIHELDLTDAQIHLQCKMYVAALRIADDFGCDAIGIQYQQGLKDLLPASDLVEGMLNNSDRPPIRSRDGKRILHKGKPLPHFNEVDECAGLDALMIARVNSALGQPLETTLHDVRWGEPWDGRYVWVLLISGAAPPAHFTGGWKGAHGYRQPPMYFPNGGSTLHGVSKPGEIVWSRIYVEGEKLHLDIGRGAAIELPPEETRRRLEATTPQWPIMHAVTYGISRNQFMAKHRANHIQVAYATDARSADACLFARIAFARELGISVNLCGTLKE